jgi:DNA polymerase-3 subunit delta'
MHPWNQPILDSLSARLERLPHALLVHGAQGLGKLALAERAAQLLLCEGKKRPCDACDACRWFSSGNHPDFRRLEPEALAKEPPPDEDSESPAGGRKTKQPSIVIKIDQVRGLSDFLYTKSHRGRLRVVLVHPAEAMNEDGANALLKGLEEPPPGVVFILVSHRPARLLPTIRSRCVAVPVPIPNREVALQWMAAKGVKQPERWLAYAGGAPLEAVEQAGRGEVPLAPVNDREALEPLAEALQKTALDHALLAFGLPAKYQTASGKVPAAKAREWLAYARRLGEDRQLARHPLTPRLFSISMLGAMPNDR